MKTLDVVPVRTAAPAEERQVLATMVLAFSTDPIVRWMYPEPEQYLRCFPEQLRLEGREAFQHGTAYYTDGFSGAALWLPPGAEYDEEALGALFEAALPEEKFQAVISVVEQLHDFLPTEKFWFLPYIGVEPARQRGGYGSALMRHALALCDREQCLAYLEATSLVNARLYERHGFEVVGTLQEGTMPPLFPMVRPPRSI